MNKADVTKRKRTRIDIERLGELLACKVFFTQATYQRGLKDVVACAIEKSGAELSTEKREKLQTI